MKPCIKLLVLIVLSCLFSAQAQSAANSDVTFDLGFGDELVADAWNPLRVTLRDLGKAELILELEVGNLRQGQRTLRYRAELAGGAGLYTFSDDVYLPNWRAFSWLVRTSDEVLASGSIERRRADTKPLELVLARTVSEGNRYYANDRRVVDVLPDDLPERAAAYDGVSSLLVLPSTTPPTAGAVAAAATAGASVVLAGPLGPAHAALLGLAAQPTQRLGAGWLVRVPSLNEKAVQEGLSHRGLESGVLAAALLSPDLTRIPPNPSVMLVLAVLGGYAIIVSLLVRFGRAGGLLAALLLAALLSFGTERLRPEALLLTRTRTLSLNAGDLALETDLDTLFSYPAQVARLPQPLRPLDPLALDLWESGPERFEADLPRYTTTVLLGKPHLNTAALRWEGGALVNSGEADLGEVFDTENGTQPNVGAGRTSSQSNGNLIAPALYAKLAPLLPAGSVIARAGGTVYVALPPPEPQQDGGL